MRPALAAFRSMFGMAFALPSTTFSSLEESEPFRRQMEVWNRVPSAVTPRDWVSSPSVSRCASAPQSLNQVWVRMSNVLTVLSE